MELQWPLILFTTFIAWSAGLFATQCLYALRGKGEKTQMAAWIVAAVLLVAGGIAVFMHLQHWERIFNGFGHITSGITQELIFIVVLAIVAIVYLVQLRKNDAPAKGTAIVGIIVSVVLVCVMGHSYMMPSRPTWDTVLQVLSLIGASCLLGPATFAFLASLKDDAGEGAFDKSMLWGSIINAATTIAYLIAMTVANGAFGNYGYYFDPTRATYGMTDTASFSPFSGDAIAISICAIIFAIVPIVAAKLGKKQGWKVWGAVAVIAGVAAALCLRVVFYLSGGSVFVLF